MHVAEDALSDTSITILCIFVVELLAKLVVFGWRYYAHSWCERCRVDGTRHVRACVLPACLHHLECCCCLSYLAPTGGMRLTRWSSSLRSRLS